MRDTKTKNIPYFTVWLLCLIGALLTAFLFGGSGGAPSDATAGAMEVLLRFDGWQLIERGGGLTPVALPSSRYPGFERNVYIVNTLPGALETGTTLAFESVNTRVEVWVDGEPVYQNADPDTGRAYSMWNYIPMDTAYAEGRVTIRFSGTDPYDAGILPEILLGPRSEILLLAQSENDLNTQLSVSVMFFGALVFLFALVTYTDDRLPYDFILLGLFISLLGLAQQLLIVSPAGSGGYAKQNLGSALSGLLPAMYCFYRREHAPEAVRKKYGAAFWAGIGIYLAAFVLRWLAPNAALPLHTVSCAVFEGLYGLCLYGALRWEREDSRSYRTLVSASLLALMLGMGLEGFTHLGYTVMRLCRPMVLGAFVFALFQAAAAMLYSYSHVERQSRMARELMESRITLMMNQLKPHYIRNSLSVIHAMIRSDPEKARGLLSGFTKYLTYNIEMLNGTELIPFAEELQHMTRE